jgi:cyclopropane fatty-acyl-phospholipid synthase-like methyltransferase
MAIISTVRKQFREMLRPRRDRAREFVGTDAVSGKLQFELLRREGLAKDSYVLEIGCGALSAGAHLIDYLDDARYVGIEPNRWLIEAAFENAELRQAAQSKSAQFLHVLDFDASGLGMKFDFVLSHSVLSHAAHHQLEQFLRNAAKVLAPAGVIVASIRLAEGNPFGSPGAPNRDDSRDAEWVYPGVSWFKRSTLEAAAEKLQLKATYRADYTEYYTRTRPLECHDWFVFTRLPVY